MKPIDQLKSVLCGPDGKCCITGSDADRAIVDRALQALAQPEQEPLEYWNAVEGWVKIDEVRQHFETVNCGTIYKNAGEGRVPLYTTPPKREWVGLTEKASELVYEDVSGQSLRPQDYRLVLQFAVAVEAKLKELNHD